jgi:hypothetical protein
VYAERFMKACAYPPMRPLKSKALTWGNLTVEGLGPSAVSAREAVMYERLMAGRLE